jgi:hypothetical protein
MNAEPFILTGPAAGLLVGLTGRLFRPELRTRRAGAAMHRTLGPVGKPEIERIEYAGRQITGIR